MTATHPSAAELALPFAGCTWQSVTLRHTALPELGADVLLHAGPPLAGVVPAAIRNAAAQALLFEGMAGSFDEACRLVAAGAFRLVPAQDHGVVTPLAQVVSASMPLAVVGDASKVFHAPLVEGGAPALRFGSGAPECRSRLEEMARLGVSRLSRLLAAAPLALAPVVAQALAEGDECHARTGAANALLIKALVGLDDEEAARLLAMPGFVLPVLMAAAAWALHTAADTPGAIVGAGGNGVRFGLRLKGVEGWQTVFASPPCGPQFAGAQAGAADVLPAIGDSAVIDFCGLGGQALHAAPELLREWGAWLPADAASRRRQVVNPRTGLVDAGCIAASGQAPWVNLAMLDLSGARGLVGRGFYAPPVELFKTALHAHAI